VLKARLDVGARGAPRGPPQEVESVPVKLLHTLSTDGAWVTRMEWSPDGSRIAAGCGDNRVRVWNVETGTCTVLNGHKEVVSAVTWSPSGNQLASASADKTVRVWNVDEERALHVLTGHSGFVRSLAWIDEGGLASGAEDDTIRVWDLHKRTPAETHRSSEGWCLSLATAPGLPGYLAAGFGSGAIALFSSSVNKPVRKLRGHKSWIDALAWHPDSGQLVSGSGDKTVRIWNTETGKQVAVLEGHTAQVRSVACSADGHLLASKSDDDTVRLWDMRTWHPVDTLDEPRGHFYWPPSIAFHPQNGRLATLGDGVRVWTIDVEHAPVPAPAAVKYVAAKIALVGDSGVGKTSLGWRLAHDEFKDHRSTHGQQFWVAKRLGMTRRDGTECESVLWDFAGQPDYRIVHALFMEDVDLALVLFDPTKGIDGVHYWLKQLPRGEDRPPSILVAARYDVGVSSLTPAELQSFCTDHAVTGGWIGTSARTAEGVDELLDRIRRVIDWTSLPATVTTATFKRIKEHVLKLKEDSRRASYLVTAPELESQLRMSDAEWVFSAEEMMTAVRHLTTHGYVSIIRASNGQQLILLAPDLLAGVASSLVLEARRNDKGLGALEERRILSGDFVPAETETLSETDLKLLLDAALVLFLEHNVCFRQTLGAQTLLIFPALINQKRPHVSANELVEYFAYRITGAVENVYASLVVQLGYTGTFARTNQWQNQAEYETATGDVCGFRQTEEAEGEIELVLYHGRDRAHARGLFQELVEMFLRGRDVVVTKFPPVICAKCGYHPQRAEVTGRVTAGKDHLFCGDCGTLIALASPQQRNVATAHEARVRQETELTQRRRTFEAAVVRLKRIAAERCPKAPTCFVSYAWGEPAQERWVAELVADLENMGVEVVLDRRNPIGTNLARFVELIGEVDYVLVVGTRRYLLKYDNKVSVTGSVVAAEVDLIQQRLLGTESEKRTVLPLLLDGDESSSLPPLARRKVYADFRNQGDYFSSLFDLGLTMHSVPLGEEAVTDLREVLRNREMVAPAMPIEKQR